MEQIITVSPGKVFFTDIKVPVHILMCVSYIRVHLSITVIIILEILRILTARSGLIF